MSTTLQSLRLLLNDVRKNHETMILNERCLKDAHIYCKIHHLSGQVSGYLLERYIQTKFNLQYNNSSLCSGDVSNGTSNLEIKISNGGRTNFSRRS